MTPDDLTPAEDPEAPTGSEETEEVQPAAPKRRIRRRKAAAEPAAEAEAQDEPTAAEPEADELESAAPENEPVAESDDEPVAEDEADDDEDEAEDEDDEELEAEAAGAAAPSRARRGRRGERDPDLPPQVVRAQAKYVRSSARKARLVCDNLRGKSVDEARAILALTPRAVAREWSKLLESAVANAEHNHELVGEDLFVMAIHADEGPTIKRFRPRAMGRATKIRKRTSHLTILLTPKD